MKLKKRVALIGIIISIVAGLISGIDVIGEIAKTPNVLIIFFSGMAGGASLVSYISKTKRQ